HIILRAKTGNEDWTGSKLDLTINVEDTGMGIPEDQQELIFKEFEQLQDQDIRKYGGTGLGLSISKRLTKLMGGEISLRSQVGKGTTFTLQLKDVDISSVIIEAEEPVIPSKLIHFAPANVLVVDDLQDNRNLLKECFADTPLSVSEAENGLDAVKQVEQGNFDAVLMDIRMPVMDGYQAAEEIKAFSKVPIIALTASVMQDEYERTKNVNFDGYLRKPVRKGDLMNELKRFLAFEAIQETAAFETTLILAEAEMIELPEVITELEKLLELCGQISKNNNMTEIKKFADTILTIGKNKGISVVSDYATGLQSNIDCFDIVAIKKAINNFHPLVGELRSLADQK
ncbi:partial two-component system, NarL family, sensor histidine kinase EvgS, partial [biofilm metagenome]